MAIVTRAGKGSALTHTEMDANLNEINLKAPVNSPAFTGRTLVGTSTDNGVDRLQVNGSISCTDAKSFRRTYSLAAGASVFFDSTTGWYMHKTYFLALVGNHSNVTNCAGVLSINGYGMTNSLNYTSGASNGITFEVTGAASGGETTVTLKNNSAYTATITVSGLIVEI
jgi:hypothetical protein